MIDFIKFILFLVYSTSIFFLPNNKYLLILIGINLVLNILNFKHIQKVTKQTLTLLPFILFTFSINWILDSFLYASYMALKLVIVCNTTFIYSSTTTTLKVAKTIELLFSPLKLFRVDTTDIKIIVCIALSMIPIFKSELTELKNGCKAKNIDFNIKNMKYILTKFFISLLQRVNKIEESLISKGYNL